MDTLKLSPEVLSGDGVDPSGGMRTRPVHSEAARAAVPATPQGTAAPSAWSSPPIAGPGMKAVCPAEVAGATARGNAGGAGPGPILPSRLSADSSISGFAAAWQVCATLRRSRQSAA